MKRAWSIQRRFAAKTNSQTRWDQVYQHLLLWTTKRAGEVIPPARTPEVSQEVSDADCHLCARVSTTRQAQAQTIDQQLTRVRSSIEERGETVDECNVFRAAGYSGATLNRPGLDQLRDRTGLAEFDRVVVTAPDRLART